MNRFIGVLKALKIVLYSCTVALIFVELLFILLIEFPAIPKMGLNKIVEILYLETRRNIIQMDLNLSRYDNRVTYTLKPGVFKFSNPEFSNTFKVNRLGLRDDEKSLYGPDIIVCGDSYAMGWGVEQDETFAQILEKGTGLKVLNTAIASYGTVREMRMLKRVDKSNLKILIVFYCENDFIENGVFYNFNDLQILQEKDYEKEARDWSKKIKYYPFKYVSYLIKRILPDMNKKMQKYTRKKDEVISDGLSRENEAKYFINALLKIAKIKRSEVRLIVLSRGRFIDLFEKEVSRNNYPDFIKNSVKIDLDELIDSDMLYALDGHYKAEGHAAIAGALMKVIDQK